MTRDVSDVVIRPNGMTLMFWSPDQKFLIDTWSRVDAAPVTELRRADDGKYLCRLEEADLSEVLATEVAFLNQSIENAKLPPVG